MESAQALTYSDEMDEIPDTTSSTPVAHKLLHEVWQWEEDGMPLSSLALAGPGGDGQRAFQPADARLVATLWAVSHCDAMTQYHRLLGREEYTTDQPWDYEPYPEEWVVEQRDAGIRPE
ncbi:MAG TPA: hypothetical protein VMF30_00255 [Pirellulales bacterium]|nr:hypothetical protein [Pirellulales bacterium]